MKIKYFLILPLVFLLNRTGAQQVEVTYDYNGVGDCIFSAQNDSKVPVFLHLNFADLENTSFTETLPYVKLLTPGFNALFTLQRDLDAGYPRFNYELKSFRSNPMAKVDLKFPYLIPFDEGTKVRAFDVKEVNGFLGSQKLDAWSATGFYAAAGTKVLAARNGVVVDVAGASRNEEPETWYNGWNYNVTLLQADGTLLCYRNVFDRNKKLQPGQKVFAGEELGEIAPGTDQLVMLIYHHSLNTKGLLFVIPTFALGENKKGLVNSSAEYTVIHPNEVRGLEMTKRERKKILGKGK